MRSSSSGTRKRLLEQSRAGRTTGEGADQERSARGASRRTPRPGPGSAGGSRQEFRRAVVEGLATERSGRLAPAVRRYAEGLLR
jgi:hypothetical protein